MRELPHSRIAEANLVAVDLLITDAKIALTLLDLAETTAIAEDRIRRIGEAEKAYRNILHFVGRLSPTNEQSEELGREMALLGRRLRASGVELPEP